MYSLSDVYQSLVIPFFQVNTVDRVGSRPSIFIPVKLEDRWSTGGRLMPFSRIWTDLVSLVGRLWSGLTTYCLSTLFTKTKFGHLKPMNNYNGYIGRCNSWFKLPHYFYKVCSLLSSVKKQEESYDDLLHEVFLFLYVVLNQFTIL